MKPFKFIQEVRREGSKVTWPTSRETLTGSVMVVLITAFAAVFSYNRSDIQFWIR